jgi:hypothetical protein
MLAFVSPLALTGVGVLAIVAEGMNVISLVLVLIGGLLLLTTMFDFPIWTSFDHEGIVRRTVLRAHRLPWSRLTTVARAPASRLKPRNMRRAGPLVATIGRRRYLLLDCPEGPDEYNAVRSYASAADNGPLMQAEPPAEGTAPTWLYHRKRSL